MSDLPKVSVTITISDGWQTTTLTKSAPRLSGTLGGGEGAILQDVIDMARAALQVTEHWTFGLYSDE